jgi:hypothetical protein
LTSFSHLGKIYKKESTSSNIIFGSAHIVESSVMKTGACLMMFVFAFALAGLCSAVDNALCPDMIRVEQRAISPSPEWSITYNPAPHQLEMVTFLSGPPQENASLVYDEKSEVKGGWVGTWKFPRDPRGYWIRCSYEGTRAELSRRLPDSVSVCRVIYTEGMYFPSGLPVIKKIECR